MSILSEMRQHHAVASGNFDALFKDFQIPQLPQAVACLVAEFNKPDPDIQRLAKIVSTDVEVTIKVLKTVNSALYGLSNPVSNLQNAIMILGLKRIRTIALSYAVKEALPKPEEALFNQEAFWTDSLVRALLARSLARISHRGEEDEAFTAALLSNLALPVLLSCWGRYYAPVLGLWMNGRERLSQEERDQFNWDHAQAGAWVLESWNFPDEIMVLVGSHNVEIDELRKIGLAETIALPVVVASLLPSVLRPSQENTETFRDTVLREFSLDPAAFKELLRGVSSEFNEIREQFGLENNGPGRVFEGLLDSVEAKEEG